MADLSWSGAGASVEIYRNGVRVATLSNRNTYTDDINQKGSGTYAYEVCNAGSNECAGAVTVTF